MKNFKLFLLPPIALIIFFYTISKSTELISSQSDVNLIIGVLLLWVLLLAILKIIYNYLSKNVKVEKWIHKK